MPRETAEPPPWPSASPGQAWGWDGDRAPLWGRDLPAGMIPLAAAALLAPAPGVKQLCGCVRACARNLVSDATPGNKFLPVEGKGNVFM